MLLLLESLFYLDLRKCFKRLGLDDQQLNTCLPKNVCFRNLPGLNRRQKENARENHTQFLFVMTFSDFVVPRRGAVAPSWASGDGRLICYCFRTVGPSLSDAEGVPCVGNQLCFPPYRALQNEVVGGLRRVLC